MRLFLLREEEATGQRGQATSNWSTLEALGITSSFLVLKLTPTCAPQNHREAIPSFLSESMKSVSAPSNFWTSLINQECPKGHHCIVPRPAALGFLVLS